MFNIKQFALNMIANNPQVANNPQAQQLIEVIKSGDAKRGQELANDILNQNGLTKEQAMKDISMRFGIPMN